MRRRSAHRPVRRAAAPSRQCSSLPWTSSLSHTPRQHISSHRRASWAMTARFCAQTVQSSFDFSLLPSTHPDPPRRAAGAFPFSPANDLLPQRFAGCKIFIHTIISQMRGISNAIRPKSPPSSARKLPSSARVGAKRGTSYDKTLQKLRKNTEIR